MKKIKNFGLHFIKLLSENEADFASTYLAYHLLLSFIPLLVFLSHVLIYIAPGFQDLVYNLMRQLPNDVKNIFMPIIENIFNSQSSSLSIIAILSSIRLGSRGFLGLVKALNKIFEVDLTGKIPFYEIIFSVFYTVIFMVLMASILLFTVFNDTIAELILKFTDRYPVLSNIASFFFSGLNSVMPLIFSIVIFIVFYRYAPSFNRGNRISFKSATIGAAFATLGIALVTLFYRFTNDTLSRSPSIYGSLGSLLVTLVWLLAICQMIIYGAIFIKTYTDMKHGLIKEDK
ncbi:YihY family protein [Helcococcus kunzii ATCC 51366]|uniref:YihY family protein n=1 Tax=Helcococcus kunzii ATCC 51366 TaxID=883114 RepID=H3NPU7_9FIRM|nr:YihY/virulence factor BrkB family protein [Helcococcus kunzii]EHR33325.1 YihY family protein [Helcococcus kunzii ATCC 51366]